MNIADLNVRIDMMWPIPSYNHGDAFADTISMLVEEPDDLPKPLSELLATYPEQELDIMLDTVTGDEHMELWNEFFFRLRASGVAGFLAQVSTPSPTYTSDTQSYYSWGSTRHTLIFGATYEDLLKEADAFEQQVHAEAKKRFTDA